MTIADRWVLPEGIDESLPDQAGRIESLRRTVLDLFCNWGYDFVIPPLIEFTESLLIERNPDIDLQTFKVVDQLSGRTMGVRADITPQVARIDAHCLHGEGLSRLCYAGSVLHTRAKGLHSSRSPIQVGAELYGEAGLSADLEVITLMHETLKVIGLKKIHVDLGHVGIYRGLVRQADLSCEQEAQLFELLQRKARVEIDEFIAAHISDAAVAKMLGGLIGLSGDESVLAEARTLLAGAPADVIAALDSLEALANMLVRRLPDAEHYFDLAEVRGYHYHTGLVFAAYVPGAGRAVAKGGRYDEIGQLFGKARPATGFDLDLKAVASLLDGAPVSTAGIFAPAGAEESAELWAAVVRLRVDGERVVCGLDADRDNPVSLGCDRELVLDGGQWVVKVCE